MPSTTDAFRERLVAAMRDDFINLIHSDLDEAVFFFIDLWERQVLNDATPSEMVEIYRDITGL